MLIREDYLSKIRGFYDSNLIKILVGIRRCGKSVILNQIIEELKGKRKIDEEHIIFINFEFIILILKQLYQDAFNANSWRLSSTNGDNRLRSASSSLCVPSLLS